MWKSEADVHYIFDSIVLMSHSVTVLMTVLMGLCAEVTDKGLVISILKPVWPPGYEWDHCTPCLSTTLHITKDNRAKVAFAYL